MSMSKFSEYGKMGGRPPHYETPEALQAKVDEYFDTGVKKKTYIVGKGENQQIVEIPIPTITGLVLYLGFCDRQSFYDYEKRDGFSYTIKNARTRIEQHYEELVQDGNSGAIFALKNFGWSDKQELEMSGNLATNNTHTLKNINDWYDKHRDDKGQ